ncbi:MAG TPA: hypothetical protein VGB43_04960 [Flavobacterium sp.]
MKRLLLFSAFLLMNAIVSCTSDEASEANSKQSPAHAEGIGGQGGGTPIPPPPPPPPVGP